MISDFVKRLLWVPVIFIVVPVIVGIIGGILQIFGIIQ